MTGDPIVTLRCPNCGAPAAPESARCDYCHSRLATVSCPKCLGALFAGSRFCPHCGVARDRVEGTASTSSTCPSCKGAMSWVAIGNIDLLECGTCDGTWIEAVTFERLCADRDAQSAILHTSTATAPQAGVHVDQIHYRPCLRCGKLMNRVNFGLVSGAIVDVCKGHGTYLDRGELHQVVQFILDGGLDRMREIKREALVDEEHRLRDLERAQGGGAVGSASTWNDSAFERFMTALKDRV
jgi:Zn-finger nucleic acid-binding protein